MTKAGITLIIIGIIIVAFGLIKKKNVVASEFWYKGEVDNEMVIYINREEVFRVKIEPNEWRHIGIDLLNK